MVEDQQDSSPATEPKKKRGSERLAPASCCANQKLRQEGVEYLAFAEERDGPARRRRQLLMRVQAQLMEDGGRDVVGQTTIGRRGHAVGVGGAVAVAVLEAAARQEHGERPAPVIAAGTR